MFSKNTAPVDVESKGHSWEHIGFHLDLPLVMVTLCLPLALAPFLLQLLILGGFCPFFFLLCF